MDFENPRDFWSPAKTRYWVHVFKETASGVIDTWDYRWLYSNWKNSRLAIIPNANLVLNVGFGEDATHTRDKVLPWWLPIERNETYKVNITPRTLPRDSVADKWMETNHFRSNLRLQLRNQVSIKYPRISAIYKKYFKKQRFH